MPIELKNVSYKYAPPFEVCAVNNVSLCINDGEFIGIMGHTGCGKTTMIQLIAGLMSPTGGRVFLDGMDINDKNYNRHILRRSIGIVFQNPEYQLFENTVKKDVAFGLKYSGLIKSDTDARIKWALETMGFNYDQICNQSPLALSGGEKRRVAIAGVLVSKPKILIFDEPIAGLDPNGRSAFLELIAKLNRDGITILMISHNTDSLCEYANRIIVLENGCIARDGTPKEVFANNMNVCASRQIADMLRDKGFHISNDIVKYDELLNDIKAALKGGDSI